MSRLLLKEKRHEARFRNGPWCGRPWSLALCWSRPWILLARSSRVRGRRALPPAEERVQERADAGDTRTKGAASREIQLDRRPRSGSIDRPSRRRWRAAAR